jgi:hypothetical protein
MSRFLSRRALLRGAGVTLALPWLESLWPKAVRAQAAGPIRRFLPVFLPNGASEHWWPAAAGSGSAWQLSPVLEPFGASLKPKLNIVTGLENGSVFNADGSPNIDPSHARLAGAWLTCMNAAAERLRLDRDEANGVSVDQIVAQHEAFAEKTALGSLQLGLSTPLADCENEPCSSSRSVSWATSTQPMYKLVNPLYVFNQLVRAQPMTADGAAALEAQKRFARNKSVIDAVLENARRTRTRLGASDQHRMDEFLDSVRGVERRVTGVSASMGGLECTLSQAPTLAVEQSELAPRQTTETYDKGLHADAMNDLVAMAFECDITRVISYMLEDERSEFTYDHVQVRAFTPEGSTPATGVCPEYHAAQHRGGDEFASITWWNVGKVAELCRRLDRIEEAPGVSVLDNCVVLFGGCMQGGSHRADDLPVALIGGRNLGLKNDQHVVLERRPLRDLYTTLLNSVFGLGVEPFGQNLTGAPPVTIAELLEG